MMVMGRGDPTNFQKGGSFKRVNQENQSNRVLTPYFVVSHIDILGMSRLLNTLDDFCDLSDFQYVSKDMRKRDPLVHLDASELSQIKGM